MKAGLRLAALAAITVATLAGCVRLTSDTTVKADDTFSQVAVIAVTDDARAQLESLAKVDLADLKGTITSSEGYLALIAEYPDQVTVEDFTDGDLSGVTITATDLPLDAFESSWSQLTAQLPLTGDATLVHAGDTFVVSIPSGALADSLANAGISASQLALVGGSVDVGLTFTFPGLVESASAGEINGNSVTLGLTDLASGSDITIVASADTQFYWKPWLMWGGIALLTLLIVGGAAALIAQDVRRHRANELPQPDAPATGAAAGPGVLPMGDEPEATDPPTVP